MSFQIGVDDGIRTHDNRDHNPGLYQLSYVHRTSLISRLACPAGLEPATLGLEGRCSIRLSYGHDPKAPLAGPAARGRESYVSGSSSVNFRCSAVPGYHRAEALAPRPAGCHEPPAALLHWGDMASGLNDPA